MQTNVDIFKENFTSRYICGLGKGVLWGEMNIFIKALNGVNWLEYIWQSIRVRFDHRLRALIFTDIALTPPRLIHGNLHSAVLYRCNTANKNGHKLNKICWTRLVQWPRAMGEAGSKLNIVKSLPYAPFLDIRTLPNQGILFCLICFFWGVSLREEVER